MTFFATNSFRIGPAMNAFRIGGPSVLRFQQQVVVGEYLFSLGICPFGEYLLITIEKIVNFAFAYGSQKWRLISTLPRSSKTTPSERNSCSMVSPPNQVLPVNSPLRFTTR